MVWKSTVRLILLLATRVFKALLTMFWMLALAAKETDIASIMAGDLESLVKHWFRKLVKISRRASS